MSPSPSSAASHCGDYSQSLRLSYSPSSESVLSRWRRPMLDPRWFTPIPLVSDAALASIDDLRCGIAHDNVYRIREILVDHGFMIIREECITKKNLVSMVDLNELLWNAGVRSKSGEKLSVQQLGKILSACFNHPSGSFAPSRSGSAMIYPLAAVLVPTPPPYSLSTPPKVVHSAARRR